MHRKSSAMDPRKLRCHLVSSLAFAFFLVQFFHQAAALDLSSDKQALLDFAASVHHGRRLTWSLNTPACSSWIGVKCTKDGRRVIGVRLPGIGLTGNIPPNSLGKLDALQVLSLRLNELNGTLPADVASLPSLRYLYLQHNKLSGDLPVYFSPKLNSIDLSFNSFTGEIPTGTQNLSRLTRLNLEHNLLSGPIPDLKLPKLSHLNVQFNNLNGSIPRSLQSFPKDSFVGNQHLCGLPLPQCPALLPPPSPSFHSSPLPAVLSDHRQSLSKKFTTGVMIAIISAGLTILILLAIILLVCLLKREDREEPSDSTEMNAVRQTHKEEYGSGVQGAERGKMTFFDSCSYNFDLEDLLRASAEVLGKGSFGISYKAIFEDGAAMVVKRLKEVAAGKKDFEQQMEIIGKIGHHPNILPLCSYYYAKDEKLLVYEYSAGNFFTLLHGNRTSGRTPLNWDTRLKIMLGAAKGIAHIHSTAGARFSHGNIKSSNILLTEDLHPLVSDYGIAPLMSFLPPPPPPRAAVGYLAPEFIDTRKHTHGTDVYGFGVLLLEMLTGKSPVRAPGQEEIVDLPRWVQSVVREEWTAEVFDVELMKFPDAEEEMVGMLQIALACTDRDPRRRPVMEEVVGLIEELRPASSDGRLSSDAK